MFKKNQLIFIILIIVILSLAITLIAQIRNTRNGASKFSAVYLEGGDIYFGELSWFPSLKIKNGWYLQRGGVDSNSPQLSLNPLSSVFWGPENEISLNRNKVIFWAKLRSDSQVAKFLENPTAAAAPNADLSPTP